MARIHAQGGRLYVGIANSTAAPEPVAFLNSFDITAATDKAEVTAYEDGNKIYVNGKEDFSGSYAGFYDTETEQTYTSASDGQARRFYFYPAATNNAQYWYGDAIFDFSASFPVSGPAAISGSWSAASDITKKSS